MKNHLYSIFSDPSIQHFSILEKLFLFTVKIALSILKKFFLVDKKYLSTKYLTRISIFFSANILSIISVYFNKYLENNFSLF